MSDARLHTILSGVKTVLMALGFILGILLVLKGSNAALGPGHLANEEKSLTENISLWEEQLKSASSEEEKDAIQSHIDAINGNISFNSILNVSMGLTNSLIIGGLILAVLFAIYLTVSNLKGSMAFLIGLAAFALIAIICWFTASSAMPEAWALKNPEMFSPGNVKFADFGIKLVNVLSILAIALIALGSVWSIVKRFSA